MADLDDQLAEQQSKLAELHQAFGAKLASDMSKHKEQCAALSSEVNVQQMVATDKLKLAMELDAALKERAIALDRREQAQNEKHIALRARAAAVLREMETEAAARAQAAKG